MTFGSDFFPHLCSVFVFSLNTSWWANFKGVAVGYCCVGQPLKPMIGQDKKKNIIVIDKDETKAWIIGELRRESKFDEYVQERTSKNWVVMGEDFRWREMCQLIGIYVWYNLKIKYLKEYFVFLLLNRWLQVIRYIDYVIDFSCVCVCVSSSSQNDLN